LREIDRWISLNPMDDSSRDILSKVDFDQKKVSRLLENQGIDISNIAKTSSSTSSKKISSPSQKEEKTVVVSESTKGNRKLFAGTIVVLCLFLQ